MLVYEKLARNFIARENARLAGKEDWQEHWENEIEKIIREYLPHGSGVDAEITFDYERSQFEKLVLYSSYHVIDENGFYAGWIDFQVIVRPSLAFGIKVDIRGKFGNRWDLKDYLTKIFGEALTSPIKEKGVA